MKKYRINITITEDKVHQQFIIPLEVEYDKEYELQSHVIGIGKNGYLQKLENNNLVYYPAHRIHVIKVDNL